LTPHDPIVIVSDANLSAMGWPGSGSLIDPYIIEGLHITSSENCIYIEDTRAYFVIRNCIMDGYTSSNYGVYLNNVSHGIVDNCTIEWKCFGVCLTQSTNCTIFDSNIRHCRNSGVYLASVSHDNNIANNTFVDNGRTGIEIVYSDEITIENNTFADHYELDIEVESGDMCIIRFNRLVDASERGIYIYYSNSGIIANNSVHSPHSQYTGSRFGIRLHDSSSWVIGNNTLTGYATSSLVLDSTTHCKIQNNTLDNGLIPDLGIGHEISNNIVRGKMLGYFTGISNEIIDGSLYGQIALSSSNNVTVHNGNFDWVGMPLSAYYCSNCIFQDNTITNAHFYGIDIRNSDDTQVKNNNFDEFQRSAVIIRDSPHTIVNSNSFNNGTTWSSLDGVITLYDSEFSEITDNTIEGYNAYGIHVASFHVLVDGNYMSSIESSDILLQYAEDCTISNNILGTGVSIGGWELYNWIHTFSGNTVAGKSLGYYLNSSDDYIDGSSFSQIFIINSTELSVYGMNSLGGMASITLAYSSNCFVDNMELVSRGYACNLYWSSNCTLSNVVSSSGGGGFYLYHSDNIFISNCNFTKQEYYGLQGFYGYNLTIVECEFSENRYGIYLSRSHNCTIVDNLVRSNVGIGISLGYETFYCQLYGNRIGWNEVTPSHPDGRNGYDSGSSNTWDDGVSTGNYWSDYAGYGVYEIPGSAQSIDRYPELLEGSPTATVISTVTTIITPIQTPGAPQTPPTYSPVNTTTWWQGDFLGIPILGLLGSLSGMLALVMVLVSFRRI
jgi:parallel beta-helix repeat protein